MSNVIKFQKDMRNYIRIVESDGDNHLAAPVDEQADADDMYGDIDMHSFGRQNGETFTNHGHGDLKIKPNDARFGDNPLAPPGGGASLEEFADAEIEPQMDQLHQALLQAGVTDLEIRQGLDLTDSGWQKMAGRLGVSPDKVRTLMNSLTQKLSDDDASTTDALLSDYYTGMSEGADAPMWPRRISEDNFSIEKDEVGDNRIHDPTSVKRKTNGDDPLIISKQGDGPKANQVSKRPFDAGTMFEDKRFSVEPDALGNVTIRDRETGNEKFLKATDASAVKAKLDHGADSDTILAPLMEKTMNPEDDDTTGYADEINADAGSYNFQWNFQSKSGTGTMTYSTKGNRPNFRLISVRDQSGDDVLDHLDSAVYRSIVLQAKKFIGQA